jgi:hypothetical protein
LGDKCLEFAAYARGRSASSSSAAAQRER